MQLMQLLTGSAPRYTPEVVDVPYTGRCVNKRFAVQVFTGDGFLLLPGEYDTREEATVAVKIDRRCVADCVCGAVCRPRAWLLTNKFVGFQQRLSRTNARGATSLHLPRWL
jgi:hypothetical protein